MASEPTRREMANAVTAFMLESSRRTTRAIERSFPRRQASVIVSINEGTVNAPPHTYTHITDSAITRSPNPVPAHARRSTNEIAASTNEAWRTIGEALVSETRAADRSTRSDPAALTSNSTAPEFRNEIRRIRQLTQMRDRLRTGRTSQPPVEAYEISLDMRHPSHTEYDVSQGLRTAGLAMSQDGRTLYCATVEGIFEFKMNLHVRKAFPAITPR